MLDQVLKYKLQVSIGVLMIFYSVGIIGTLLSENPLDFLKLTWLNLTLSAAILFWNHQNWNRNICLAIICGGLIGFTFEVAGVQTGVIFGEYWYGDTMGIKLFGVPLTIALNWAMLCYASVLTLKQVLDNKHVLVIIGAILLLLLDLLIEPVAMAYDFWDWKNGEIPIQNFVAWGLIAVLINYLIESQTKHSTNTLAKYLLMFQFVFFSILNMSI